MLLHGMHDTIRAIYSGLYLLHEFLNLRVSRLIEIHRMTCSEGSRAILADYQYVLLGLMRGSRGSK